MGFFFRSCMQLCYCTVPVCVPAAVIVGMTLQRAGSAGQAHTGEGVVVAERRVREAGGSVRLLLVDVFPVGLEARGA